jgi:hypothetical protein
VNFVKYAEKLQEDFQGETVGDNVLETSENMNWKN